MAKEQVVEAEETKVEVPEELSLRDQLIAARDESQARQEKLNEVDQLSPGGSDVLSTTREGASASDDKSTGTQAKPGDRQSPDKPDASSAPQPVAQPAPRSWSDQEKPLWAKVPPEVQSVINRRETEFSRKVAEQDEIRSAGTQFMTVANKYAPVIQARGTTPAAYFDQLLGIVAQIDNARTPQDRAAVFEQIARQQGVDLRQALGLANGSSPSPQVPLQTLVQQSVQQQLEQWQARQAQEQEQAVMQATTGEIEAFRSKVNEQGLPAYPYFDHVVTVMAGLVQSGAAQTLEEAYTLAVRAHPETSKLLVEAEKAEAAAKEAKRLAAEKAKRKGGSVRGSMGSIAPGNSKDRTLREELQAAASEVRSRI